MAKSTHQSDYFPLLKSNLQSLHPGRLGIYSPAEMVPLWFLWAKSILTTMEDPAFSIARFGGYQN